MKLDARRAVAFAAAGLVLLLIALTFDAAPLIVPGVGLIIVAALAPAWVLLAVRPVRIERHLSASRVVEDEPVEAVLTVRRGLFGLPGAVLHDPLLAKPFVLEAAGSGWLGLRPVELRVIARVRRRGRHSFGPATLELGDTLGLAQMTRTGAESDELLVLPRTEPVRWLGQGRRRFDSGQEAHLHSEPVRAGEVDGLRPYMPGTPAARIHWPAVARGAGLLERRMTAEPRAQPLIVLDARLQDGDADGEEHLDAAVGAAASLVLELARAGGCSVLLPGLRTPLPVASDLAAWPSVHVRFALVTSEEPSAPPPALHSERGWGTVLYVTPHIDAAVTLRSAHPRTPQIVLVAPTALTSALDARPSFIVCGCSGFAVVGRRARTRRIAA